MKYTCDKCNKIFHNSYNYTKHINRKYSCDIIFKCDKCNDIFKTNQSLECHKNKKIPCVADAKDHELEKMKILTKEKELEYKFEKLKHEKEMLELKIKSTLDKNLQIEKVKLDKSLQIENVKLEKNLQIEKVKTERKEKTASIINGNNNTIIKNNKINIKNITNNFIQHIHINYSNNHSMGDLGIIFEKVCNKICAIYYYEDPVDSLFLELFNYNTRTELFNKILKMSLDDPKNKTMFYSKDIDKFFGIYRDRRKKSDTIEVKEVDFDKEAEPLIVKMVRYSIDTIIRNIDKFRTYNQPELSGISDEDLVRKKEKLMKYKIAADNKLHDFEDAGKQIWDEDLYIESE